MKRNYFLTVVLFIVGSLFFIGCSDQVKWSGGGTLQSIGDGTANIGFIFNNCCNQGHLNFIYQDKDAGIKMRGGEVLDHDSNSVTVTYISMVKGGKRLPAGKKLSSMRRNKNG